MPGKLEGGVWEPNDKESVHEKIFRGKREYRYPSTNNHDKELETTPHYTDHRFNKEQDVFGAEEEGLSYALFG